MEIKIITQHDEDSLMEIEAKEEIEKEQLKKENEELKQRLGKGFSNKDLI